MNIYQANDGFYRYESLPGFAQFLLDERLHELSVYQVELAFKYKIPLLEKLKHLSNEMLISITEQGYREFLQYFIDNNADEQIIVSQEKWLADQLEIVGKFDIQAEDVTVINHIRQQAMRAFVHEYTTELLDQIRLNREIDDFFLGSTTSGMNTYIDILQQKLEQREKELLEAQALAKVGSFEWNMQEDVSTHTPELRKIFGDLKRGYENWMDDVHPEDRERVRDAMNASFTTGYYDCEYRYLTDEGEKILWSKGEVLFDNENKPKLMRGTVQDITEWKRIQQDLHKAVSEQEHLQQLNEYKDEFLNIASHELKTPVTSIKAFLQLTRRMNAVEGIEYIDRSLQQVKKMEKLIVDLLDASKINAGQLTYSKQEFDLSLLIKELAEQFKVSEPSRTIGLELDNGTHIYGDKLRIEQVLNNLVQNALKYSKDDIRIRMHEEDQMICVAVTDKGMGISKDEQKNLFHRFYRSNAAQMQYQGLGLGLYIANQIVKDHNGTIRVESEPGDHTTFTVCFPKQ